MKKCVACGMPMEKPKDFAMADTTKDYCRHCQRPDGSMQGYEEKKRSLTAYIVKAQGLDTAAAAQIATAMMAGLPAWRESE